MFDTEKTAPSVGAICAKIAVLSLTALAVFLVIQNAVALKNAPSGGSGADYLPYFVGTGAAFFLLEAAIVADDLVLWRGARREANGKMSVRYVLNVLCRIVCFAFVPALALSFLPIEGDAPAALQAIRWVSGRVLLAPVMILPALRLVDFVLWLAERRRKNAR